MEAAIETASSRRKCLRPGRCLVNNIGSP
jgi:hypothetical protein